MTTGDKASNPGDMCVCVRACVCAQEIEREHAYFQMTARVEPTTAIHTTETAEGTRVRKDWKWSFACACHGHTRREGEQSARYPSCDVCSAWSRWSRWIHPPPPPPSLFSFASFLSHLSSRGCDLPCACPCIFHFSALLVVRQETEHNRRRLKGAHSPRGEAACAQGCGAGRDSRGGSRMRRTSWRSRWPWCGRRFRRSQGLSARSSR